MRTHGASGDVEAELMPRDWLAVEVDVQWHLGANLQPRNLCTDDRLLDRRQPTAQQVAQRRRKIGQIYVGQNAHVEQAVVEQRPRAEHVTAPRLATIADGQHQKLSLPGEVRPAKTAGRTMDAVEARQPCEQVSSSAEQPLEIFRRLDGHLRAESARGDVDEGALPRAADVDTYGLRIDDMLERSHGVERDASRAGEVVGSAQRQDAERGADSCSRFVIKISH